MFWSSEKFLVEQQLRGLVRPFATDRLKHGAYELSLGRETFVTSSGITSTKKKARIGWRDNVVIPAGQMALLITAERVAVPDHALALISIKAGIKFKGLVNISGFHVDPGFSGRLKFSVYNASSRDVVLSRGDQVFLIWFADLDRATKDLYAARPGQDYLTSEDVGRIRGEVASPAVLKSQLDKLRVRVSILTYLGTTLLVTVVGALVLALAGDVRSALAQYFRPSGASSAPTLPTPAAPAVHPEGKIEKPGGVDKNSTNDDDSTNHTPTDQGSAPRPGDVK